MSALRIGFIGTGKKPAKPSGMGYGMAHQHAVAYQALPRGEVEIVACADIAHENARAFAEAFGVPKAGIYTEHREMLAREKLDIVSICTWPDLHECMVVDAAKARVKGIFCEKPMAYAWGACKHMHQACVEQGVKLAFNHQRRYGKPFRLAKKLIDDGAIGRLERIEFGCGNLYDYGSHHFDLSGYLAGETKAKWVIAQIDYRDLSLIFGTHNENQALVQWEYQNGILGFGSTGLGARMVGCHNRAVGSGGVVEIGSQAPEAKGKHLRYRKHGMKDWEYVDTAGEHCHGPGYIERAVADFIACTKAGRDCELNSQSALNGTEVIFAAWHSSRIHGRVDLPLTADDNALVAMVEAGALRPQPRQA
ncbi:MAG: Gfo/Idh/MocA family oxidoreductase [Planctomycetota bacterium]|nr:Gfo/Idh/MocA family oxidoreductase [Planctomycetota bacterium]